MRLRATEILIDQATSTTHAILQALSAGVCVVSAEKRALLCNRIALRILDDGSYVCLRKDNSLLCPSSDQHNYDLQQALDLCVSEKFDPTDRVGNLIVFSNQVQSTDLLLFVEPFYDPSTGQQCSLITFLEQKKHSSASVAQMRSLYGLTQAEAEICRLVIQGMTGKEIARRRNVSYETVKSQVRSVLSKTKCKRRTELIKLCSLVSHPYIAR